MMEVDVEEECLHTLALHNPVAQDLRFTVAILKINNDLERIGDLAVNIAEQAIALSDQPRVDFTPFGVYDMGPLAQTMVKQSLDALVAVDTQLAEQVCRADDEVDEIHRQLYDKVAQRISQDADQFPQLLRMLVVARNLERMADHATNIAEDVLYMAKGEIVRHGHAEPQVPR
jgi:phosphate transport system protein